MARMPTSTAAKVGVFIDPMVMMIALGMWFNRIVRVQRAKKEHVVTPTEYARSIGASGTERVVDREPSIPVYQEQPEPEIPLPKIKVNPNGVPTAITEQIGEV